MKTLPSSEQEEKMLYGKEEFGAKATSRTQSKRKEVNEIKEGDQEREKNEITIVLIIII